MEGINAGTLARECGANVLYAEAAISDMEMMHSRSAARLEEQVCQKLIHNLAVGIVNAAPKGEFEIQRVQHPAPWWSGETRYRMGVVAFSEKGFHDFVERLLNTYGDQYAKAALETKKKSLKNKLTAAVDAA